MTIRPLDLQTNFSQMPEVSRIEQARSASILAQQTLMDDQAAKQANLRKERVEELEKPDITDFKDVLSENEDNSRKDEDKQNAKHNADGNANQDENAKYDPNREFGRFLDIVR